MSERELRYARTPALRLHGKRSAYAASPIYKIRQICMDSAIFPQSDQNASPNVK